MARMLTPGEITKLSLRPGVKSIAVANFLDSADNAMPLALHLMNLSADATLYKWNTATINAIGDGLRAMYPSEESNVRS